MVSLRFNNGWLSGEFNFLLVDISGEDRRFVFALAFLGFGVALLVELPDNNF